LTELSLSYNGAGDEGTSSLLKALTKCNTTLIELCNGDISDNNSSAIYAFVVAIQAGTLLLHAGAELDLSSEGIDDVQAKRVAVELADSTTVTTLALNKNAIGPQGCIDIAGALAENRILTSIELDYNLVGDGGCAAMAVMLRENKVLTKMSLNGNGIGLTGAIALAETLRVNGTFRELGLGRNNIGNDGTTQSGRQQYQ
jgi:Ran GTPase-activating protein (RanGAP) involved in mRNA processing and transport